MARGLDANGASQVFIIGRHLDKLSEIANSAINKSIIPVQGDISSKESLAACAAKIAEKTLFVNCVIANAGSTGPTLDDLPKDRTVSLTELYELLWKPSMDTFNDTFLVNSTGMFYTLVAFMPLLDAGNNHSTSPTFKTTIKSQFIATGSIGGLSRKPGIGFAYAGSKAATIHMIKALATCLAPYHLRCNIINPGIYPSDMSAVCLMSLLRTNVSTDHLAGFHGRKGWNTARLYCCRNMPGN